LAAFNLNHPIIDDLELGPDGAPRVLSEQMDIGHVPDKVKYTTTWSSRGSL
jgi:hypothetical protein